MGARCFNPWERNVLRSGQTCVFAAVTGAGAESSGVGSLRHSLALQIRQIKNIIFPPQSMQGP